MQLHAGVHSLFKLLSCSGNNVFLFVIIVDNTLRTTCPMSIMVPALYRTNTCLHDADLGGAALSTSSSVPQGRQGRLHEQHQDCLLLMCCSSTVLVSQGRRTMPFQQVPHQCVSAPGMSPEHCYLLDF